jgi:hypothetical protein
MSAAAAMRLTQLHGMRGRAISAIYSGAAWALAGAGEAEFDRTGGERRLI